MIWPFKKRFAPGDGVYAVYDAIVAQSRQPQFYREWLVPDTVTGRFDMISLHMGLVLHRLRKASDGSFAQELFDLFFADMDRSLREMGVGDVSVPKRIEKMGAVFYGLLDKLTQALDAQDEDMLTDVINRNIFAGEQDKNAKHISKYTMRLAEHLKDQRPADIAAGKIDLDLAQ